MAGVNFSAAPGGEDLTGGWNIVQEEDSTRSHHTKQTGKTLINRLTINTLAGRDMDGISLKEMGSIDPIGIDDHKGKNALDKSLQDQEKIKVVDISVTATTNKPPFPRSKSQKAKHLGTSLWRFLLSELDIDLSDSKKKEDKTVHDSSTQNISTENTQILLNYIQLPIKLEKFMVFGILYSIIVFLKSLTIIPLRFLTYLLKRKYNQTFKDDLISVSATVITLFLLKNLDTSRIYHNIRAGTAIKLYFMMQVLEIGDRLLSASGQDIFKVLFSIKPSQKYQFIGFYIISILFLWFHSYVLVYQVMAMNVAINSYSNALLTLILSNQFSELKGAVFKKTEREGLFQITCADLNERFLLFIILVIISARNFLQIIINTLSINDFFNNFKPHSWTTQLTPWKSFDNWIGLIIGPSIYVIGSEILVDWVKHSYIIRFNRIKPIVYDKYLTVLANDYINGFKSNQSIKRNPDILTERTGFPILCVAIIFCKLTVFPYIQYQYSILTEYSKFINWLIIFFTLVIIIAVLIFFRLLLSLLLLNWSTMIIKQQSQWKKKSDYISGDPNVSLCKVSDIRESLYDSNEQIPPSLNSRRQKRQKNQHPDSLSNLVRFEMADKRIW